MFGAVSSLPPPLWPQGMRGWGKRSSACLVSHGNPGLPCEVPQLDHSVFFSPCLPLFSILESSHPSTLTASLPFSSARCVHSILCSNSFPRWHYSLPCLSPSPFLPVLWLLCPPRWVEAPDGHSLLQRSLGSCLTELQTKCCVTRSNENIMFSILYAISFFLHY